MKIIKTFIAVLFALVFIADAQTTQSTIDLSEEPDLIEKYNAIMKESNDPDGMA